MISTKYLLAVILVALASQSIAQSSFLTEKDSLDFLNGKFESVYEEDPRMGLYYLRHLMRIENRFNKIWVAQSLFHVFLCQYQIYQYDSAIYALQDCSKILEEQSKIKPLEPDILQLHSNSISAVGDMYVLKEEFTNALEWYFKAEVFAIEHNLKWSRLLAKKGQGEVYNKLGQHEKALTALNEALAMESEISDLQTKSLCFSEIMDVYTRSKNYEKALEYAILALRAREALVEARLNNTRVRNGIVRNYREVGAAYLKLKNYPEAKRYLDLSYQTIKKLNTSHVQSYMVQTLLSLADYCNETNNNAGALDKLKEAEAVIITYDIKPLFDDVYKKLSDQYKMLGNTGRSLLYLERYTEITDSLSKKKDLELMMKSGERSDVAVQNVQPFWALSNGLYILVFAIVALIGGGVVMILIKRRGHRISKHSISPPIVEEPTSNVGVQPLSKPQASMKYITGINKNGEVLVNLDTILWFEIRNKACSAISQDGILQVKQNISELETILEGNDNFARINRQVIINIDFMMNYSFWEKDKYVVRMKDAASSEFIMPRSRLKVIKQKFGIEKNALRQA